MKDVTESVVPADAVEFLDAALGRGWTAEALHGDASVRGYYRVRTPDGRTLMLSYYPESIREGVVRFVDAQRAIESTARVPAIVRHSHFAVLQHDLGDQTLFDLLRTDPERAAQLYDAAVDLLVDFQKSPPAAAQINPPFDAKKFFEELDMTREFYVEQMKGVSDLGAISELRAIFKTVAEKLESHPYLLCHRDYHGQNLHILKDVLYMIDFQDMRKGPDTYDLASLIRDRGAWVTIGRERELKMLERYAGLIGADPAALRRRYFETLLQRSIKAIGTFARQAITRGRTHYVEFIPSTVESVRQSVAELPEYRPLLDLFPAA